MNEMTFVEKPRPDIFREGISALMETPNWPKEVKEVIKKIPESGEKGLKELEGVLSEVAIKLNNLGTDGLSSQNYLAVREIIEVVMSSDSFTGKDDETSLVFVPLLWLNNLKSVKGFVNEPGAGIMKGGVVEIIGGPSPANKHWLNNVDNKAVIDSKISDWVKENSDYLIVSDGFFEK